YPQDKDLITLSKTFYADSGLETAVIGYRMEKTQDDLYNIYKVIYPLNYDPNNPPPPKSILLLGERIKDYNLTFSEKLYNINFILVSRNIYQPDLNLSVKIMRRK
ncbi:MAG: hypothetical protein HYU63_07200, partial [Armatimonadetes bacterium]|nr:hypothetical protein [Armatimonadota bacterium]